MTPHTGSCTLATSSPRKRAVPTRCTSRPGFPDTNSREASLMLTSSPSGTSSRALRRGVARSSWRVFERPSDERTSRTCPSSSRPPTGTTCSRRRGSTTPRSRAPVDALAPGPDGTWVAVVDGREVWQHAADGTWSTARDRRRRPRVRAHAPRRRCSWAPYDARLLRLARRRARRRCRGSTPSPGRDEWHPVGVAAARALHDQHRRRRRVARQRARGRHPSLDRRRRHLARPPIARRRRRPRGARPPDRPVGGRGRGVGRAVHAVTTAARRGPPTTDGLTDTVRARGRVHRRRRCSSRVSDGPVHATRSAVFRAPVDRRSRSTPVAGGLPDDGLARQRRHRLSRHGTGQVALADGAGDVWASAHGRDRLDPPRRAARRRARASRSPERRARRRPTGGRSGEPTTMLRHDSPGDGRLVSASVRSIAIADGSGVLPRTFAWSGEPAGERMRWFADGLRAAMLDQGYTEVPKAGPEVAVVLHFLDPANARPYRRKNAPTFVVALAELDAPPDRPPPHRLPAARARPGQPVRDGQPGARGIGGPLRHPRAGHVRDRHRRRRRPVLLQDRVLAVEPLATSRLVIGNEFTSDLEPELWEGDDDHAPDHPGG